MRHEMMLAVALILYIAFAYGYPPQAITSLLSSVPGKIAGLAGQVMLSRYVRPGVTMLAAIALLVSMPEWEFLENKAAGARDTVGQAPGRNVQARKAPRVDTESGLRAQPAAARPPGGNPKRMFNSKLEHFATCSGAMQ
jgi:hypothetical protein